MKEYRKELMGKYVKFRILRKTFIGRVCSIEGDIANIRGIKQKKYLKPAYHVDIGELKILTHDQVFDLGRNCYPSKSLTR